MTGPVSKLQSLMMLLIYYLTLALPKAHVRDVVLHFSEFPLKSVDGSIIKLSANMQIF